jgi:hypothetical protein
MFSGGRDSTVAAARLGDVGEELVLVTVSSSHLVGIDRVRSRMLELRGVLPSATRWVIVRQPGNLRTDTTFYKRTCLPCHHAYVVTGAALAHMTGSPKVAFGYVSYQSSWPEQTALAVSRLRGVLDRFHLRLVLPAYDLASRDQATAELTARGLSGGALEQKCLRQVSNVTLGELELTQQIEKWTAALEASLASLEAIELTIIESVQLGSL